MTKRQALIAALLVATINLATPVDADTYPRQRGVDVTHYGFRLTLSDTTDVIEGEAAIDFRVVQDGVSSITLDLVQPKPEAKDKGMTVGAVTENGTPLKFDHVNDRLTVRLNAPAKQGERHSIVVGYRGAPITGLLIAPNKYGERTFFSDNWPIKARQWLPTIDHPYDKAASDMTVIAPSHYQVVSNGLLVEETDLGDGRRLTHWHQAIPIATWLNVLGVARFAVDHRAAWRGIPIETWVYRQDRDKGFELFADPTPHVLDFLSENVGPYSYERLGNVQANGVRGGMESATSIFYGDDSVNDPKSLRWRNVIVHETAHQWFGNSVTENDWDHVWLSEAFATYFTHLFIEHAYGRDEFVAGLKTDRASVIDFDRKEPNYRIVHDNLSDMSKVLSGIGTYRKGGWVLHMLHGIIGDEAFWKGIRSYYARYRNSNASTDDFRREMEAASGLELSWFFDQWLTRGGHPVVRAQWRYDDAAKALIIETQQTQEGLPFRVPVRVEMIVEGAPEPKVERVELRGARDQFKVAMDKAPKSVAFDPETSVLWEIEIK